MKTLSYALLTVLAGSLAIPASALAERRYYTREEVRQCRSDGDAVVGGAVIGCAAGIGLNLLLGNRRGGDVAAGCAIGGVSGGVLGALGSMSCRDRTVYIENVDRYLDDGRFDRPGSWNGGGVEIHKTVYRRDGSVCHIYKSRARGETYKEVACKEGRSWRHGYDETVVIRESRSYGRWNGTTYVEEYSVESSRRAPAPIVREEVIIERRRPPVISCTAFNGRGIPFPVRGRPGESRWEVASVALENCRYSRDTYNPRSCHIDERRDCFVR